MSMATNQWDNAGYVLEHAAEAERSGDNDLAYEYYARASELNPNAAQAWRGRAATTPLADDALVSWGYAAALTPNDPTLGAELDRRLRARADAAIRSDAGAMIIVGQKLAEVGLVPQAHLLFKRASELDDSLVEGFIWAAATAGDLNETAVALKRALTIDPMDLRARQGFSNIMLEFDAAKASSPQQGQILSPTAQAVLGDSAPELIRTGENALVAGDKTLAYQAFVRATELAPKEEAAWLGRARATGDIDETLTCLEQALAINPDNMQAREARTFYRVRKLREGVRKRQEPEIEQARFAPSFAGGGGFSEEAPPEVRQRRIILLIIMIAVLLFLIVSLLVRLQVS